MIDKSTPRRLPIISKGRTTLRIASSPFGQDGLFYEIYSKVLRPYRGYERLQIPWWEVYAFPWTFAGPG